MTDLADNLPSNIEAEMGLLGAVLAKPAMYEQCLDLAPEDFAEPFHQEVWDSLGWLAREDGEINVSRLLTPLETEKRGYLVKLAGNGRLSLHVLPDYVDLIRDLSIRRQIIDAGEEIIARARDTRVGENAIQQVSEAVARVEALSSRGVGDAWVSFGEAAQQAVYAAEKAIETQGLSSGVPSGLAELDRLTGGLPRGELTILAGRAKMGKTACGGTMALNMALAGYPGAFFSLEQPKDQIAHRLCCIRAGVDAAKLRSGQVVDMEQMRRFRDAANELQALPLRINDAAGSTVEQIVLHIRALHRQGRCAWAVIDYLGYIAPSPETRRDLIAYQLEHITKTLRRVAKELDIPIVLLAQINRGTENRDDKRPGLADLRGSGAIEQDAALILLIYRPEYYVSREKPQRETFQNVNKFDEAVNDWLARMAPVRGVAELIVAAWRHGPSDRNIRLSFHPETTAFSDWRPDDGVDQMGLV